VKLERIRSVSFKTYLATVLLVALICIGTTSYVLSQSSSQTITIEPPSFTETASYTIFKVGDTIYAKNGTTGEIEFSGTDASQVIQSAINALTNGGKILIKAGTYLLSSPLTLNRYISLVGEEPYKSTWLVVNTNIPIFNLTEPDFTIENLFLDNWCDGYTQPLIKIISDNKNIQRGTIKNVMLYRNRVGYGYDDAIGIQLYAPTSGKGITFLYFDKVYIMGGFKYGIHLYAPDGGGWINGNFFTNIALDGVKYGIYIEALGSGTSGVVNRNTFSKVHIQATNDAYGVTERGFVVSGVANTFDICKVWDLAEGKCAMEILSTAEDTIVRDSLLYGLINNGQGSKLFNVEGYVTENSGTATISSSTSVTFEHGLAGTPTHVEVGWKDTGYGDWKWTANSTHITITVTNSGTYSFSWRAYYKP